MAAVLSIESNVTGLRISEELSIGVANGSAVWVPYEPNSYSDFGGEVSRVARDPINQDRQRKRGVLTDLDASGGFETDFTQNNLQSLLQGLFFADMRVKTELPVTAVSGTQYTVASGGAGFPTNSLLFGKGFAVAGNNGLKLVTASTGTTVSAAGLAVEGSPPAGAQIVRVGVQAASADVTFNVTGSVYTLGSTALNFTTLGLIPGEWIYIGGDLVAEQFATAGCNGFARVKSIAANALVLDKMQGTPATDAGTGKTIRIFFGRVLKNETGALVKRRTYQLERVLGAPDDALPSQIQSEYLVGQVFNQMQFNLRTADKITAQLDFMGTDAEQRTGVTGVKAGTRPAISSEACFNTSSDFSRIRLALTSAPQTPLFIYSTEITLTVNNNAEIAKAIGKLGGFDITVGNFEVSGQLTAYFGDITAVSAVRNDQDLTLDLHMAKSNQGVSIDIPLLNLGNGRLTVEKNRKVMVPLNADAVSGETYLSTMNHTMLMVFWDYLPTSAS